MTIADKQDSSHPFPLSTLQTPAAPPRSRNTSEFPGAGFLPGPPPRDGECQCHSRFPLSLRYRPPPITGPVHRTGSPGRWCRRGARTALLRPWKSGRLRRCCPG